MKYLPHIDGLRAISVISVILFHLDVELIKGGYVGVDIFFVISGFLITKLIVLEIEKTGDFSFSNFYIRRVRRLLPALIATLVITSLCASIIFTSEYLSTYAMELSTSIISLSNFLFWMQSGYFDAASETKALLHTWSLSVEEQFYMAWPFTLVVFYKFLGFKKLIGLICALFILNLVSIYYVSNVDLAWFKNQESALFYLMPFRVYEFMIGAFAVWVVRCDLNNKWLQELSFLIGISLVLLGVIDFKFSMLPDAYFALTPCLGAFLVILAGESKFASFFLKNRLMVGVGLVSYSLYLVHWPTIVLYKFQSGADPSNVEKILLIIFMFLLALIFYFKIERPFRKSPENLLKSTYWSNNSFLKYVFSFSLFLFCSGVLIYKSGGLESIKKELYSESVVKNGKSQRFKLIKTSCKIESLDAQECDNDRSHQVLLFGNSHEMDGFNMFHHLYGNDPDINLIMFGGTNHCKMFFSEEGQLVSLAKRNKCDVRTAELGNLDFVKSLDVIVYSANKPFGLNKLIDWEFLKLAQNTNKELKIIVLGTYVNTNRDCSEIANKFNSSKACLKADYVSYSGEKEVDMIEDQKLSRNVDFVFFDKFRALCNTRDPVELDSCASEVNGAPMFYDVHHLTFEFSQYVADKFKVLYQNELIKSGLE